MSTPPTAENRADRPRLSVFCPGPMVSVTIEPSTDGDEVHLHAGGQGVWVARMARALGADPRVALPLGGETGAVIEHLLLDEGLEVRRVDTRGGSTVYVHDRRGGDRLEIARRHARPLNRHELDDLFSVALADGIETGTSILTGTADRKVLPAATFERLARDLRAERVLTIIDLSGEQLDAAVAGGADLAKISDEELMRDHRARTREPCDVVGAARRLIDAGAGTVLVSREARPALLVGASAIWEARPPAFSVVDHRGAGDSMTAALGASLAGGASLPDAFRLAVAAGSLNVTRHGLATGPRDAIEALSRRIELERIE